MSNSGGNINGAFERAVSRWHFGAQYACKGMGRGAMQAAQAALGLREYACRELFHRDGILVAFPSLDLLAIRLGVNEKTVRRGIEKLEQAGIVRTQQRYNDSNLYFLTISPDAEGHLFAVDGHYEAQSTPQNLPKGRLRVDTKCPVRPDTWERQCSQVSNYL